MKARASILTIATSVALVAPAAHAAVTAGAVPDCGARAKHAAVHGTRSKPGIPSQSLRALQLTLIADRTATSRPLQTLCGAKITAVASNHFQVLRDSL